MMEENYRSAFNDAKKCLDFEKDNEKVNAAFSVFLLQGFFHIFDHVKNVIFANFKLSSVHAFLQIMSNGR